MSEPKPSISLAPGQQARRSRGKPCDRLCSATHCHRWSYYEIGFVLSAPLSRPTPRNLASFPKTLRPADLDGSAYANRAKGARELQAIASNGLTPRLAAFCHLRPSPPRLRILASLRESVVGRPGQTGRPVRPNPPAPMVYCPFMAALIARHQHHHHAQLRQAPV